MDVGWQADLLRWLAPFVAALKHKTRGRMCPYMDSCPVARSSLAWRSDDTVASVYSAPDRQSDLVEPTWKYARFLLIGLSAPCWSLRTHQVLKAPVRPVRHAF
jgi:hypothetical protein